MYDYLSIVNGNIAIVATLILYTFLANIILCKLLIQDKEPFKNENAVDQ